MAENPVAELRELVVHLKAWLEFQSRLGWAGVPGEKAPPPEQERTTGQAVFTLTEIREELGDCRRCKLSPSRTQIVFGAGSAQAEIMFVGEGPGEEEDLQGLPFVGAAGQVLNNLLSKLGLRREEVYIANIVKCRPPRNRDPEEDEIAQCLPFLTKQIKSIRPRVIVALGKVAAQALLKTATPITKLRGKWQRYQEIPVMPTFHPSYLSRFPRERQKTWEDMQQVMELLASHAEI